MRILLVDDDPAGLELRRMILERCGHSVFTAATVDAARAQIANSLEAVLMDLRLPEVEDGLSLLRDFHDLAPRVRIVVFSGYTPDLEGRAERAYAAEVLSKPVRTERLLDALVGR